MLPCLILGSGHLAPWPFWEEGGLGPPLPELEPEFLRDTSPSSQHLLEQSRRIALYGLSAAYLLPTGSAQKLPLCPPACPTVSQPSPQAFPLLLPTPSPMWPRGTRLCPLSGMGGGGQEQSSDCMFLQLTPPLPPHTLMLKQWERR